MENHTEIYKYGIFEVFGIELEYMIVDKNSLKVLPITDQLFKAKVGEIVSDVPNGTIAWSNELVAHVVEIKTNGPVADLTTLTAAFAENVREINERLAALDAQLLPTAAHPTMDPFTETKLWEHEYNEIYTLYNRIFDCRGHGWSNLQSMHINLPFKNQEEFGKLHAAIRVLLPIIPALSASSPILDGKVSGYHDFRMETYLHNQERIPQLMGKLIPEQVFTRAAYHERIFEPIIQAIAPFDQDGVMEHHFLNSRGAIARFDRGAIEIRVIDLQECPAADIAIASLVIEVLKKLVDATFSTVELQMKWHEDDLLGLFKMVIKSGEDAVIDHADYLALFGYPKPIATAKELWHFLHEKVKDGGLVNPEVSAQIIEKGSLSTRILKALGGDVSTENIAAVYAQLANCLAQNQLFTK